MVTWVGTALRTVGITDFAPEQIRLLTHGRVVSTVQTREVLGFSPRYTTAEAFADFVRGRGPGLLPPEMLAGAVDRIAGRLAPSGSRGRPASAAPVAPPAPSGSAASPVHPVHDGA